MLNMLFRQSSFLQSPFTFIKWRTNDHISSYLAKLTNIYTIISFTPVILSFDQWRNITTGFVRIAEDGFFLHASRSMSHPHRDGEGLLQTGAHQTLGDLRGLGAVELKHLVAVVPVVSGQANGPIGRVAGSGQQLHSASAGTFMGTHITIALSIKHYLLQCVFIGLWDKVM